MAEDTMDQHALNTGKTFVWHELYTPNMQSSLDFYQQALGFETETMEMPGMGGYTMLKMNGHGVAGVMSTADGPAQGAPPHWAVYLAVDDVDARVEKCKSLGATVVVPAMDVSTVGRMCLIQDPNGAHIWLYKPTPMG